MTNTPLSRQWTSPPSMYRAKASSKDVFLAPTQVSTSGYERFKSFLRASLAGIPAIECHYTALLLGLISLEAPGCVADLGPMLESAVASDPSTKTTTIYWYRNRVLRCRELSEQTRDLIRRIGKANRPPDETFFENARHAIARWYEAPASANPTDILDWLINDASACYLHYLPKPLAADILSVEPLEPLPVRVLSRQFRRAQSVLQIISEVAPTPRDYEEKLSDGISTALIWDRNNKGSSQWLLDELLIALSPKTRSVEASKDRAREYAIRRMATLTKKLDRADSMTALIFSAALFMLQAGTARTRHGNVATVRIYINDIAYDLYRVLSREKKHPLDLSDEDWHRILTELLEGAVDQNRRNSVAAVGKFLQTHLGIEPSLAKIIASDVRLVKANVIWPHEFLLANRLIRDQVPDLRLQQQLIAMLRIGHTAPIRIGELLLLQMRSVRVTQGKGVEYVELEIAPSKNLHQGKSAAARRVMYLGTVKECQELVAWKERRAEECAGPDNFLFGDPHEPERLFKIGQSISALNRFLKMASGDPTVSFHTLRHTVVSRLIREVFEMTDPTVANVRLKEISIMAGHGHPSTTMRHYFHFSHLALRKRKDKHLAPFLSHKNVRQGWKKLKATRQVKAHPTTETPAAATSAAIAGAPAPCKPKQLRSSPTFSPDVIRKVLLDISTGLPVASIRSRCDLSRLQLEKIIAATGQMLDAVCPPKKREFLTAEVEEEGTQARVLCERLRKAQFCFGPPGISIHKSIWSHAESIHHDKRSEAAKSWVKCFSNGFLSAENRDDLHPLLCFLKDCEVPQAHFLVRAAPKTDSVESKEKVKTFFQYMQAEIDGLVLCEPVTKRQGGRPDAYLLVTRRPVFSGFQVPAAICRMSEVHGALASCAVTVILNRKAI